MASPRGPRGDRRHHRLRSGRARRRRLRRATHRRRDGDAGPDVRRGRIEQDGLGSLRARDRSRHGRESRATGRARAGESRSLRRRLDDPSRAQQDGGSRCAPRRRGVPRLRRERAAEVNPYAPHTDADVAAMLATIGVASIDDLFAHVPAGLRARAAIDLPAGLSEPELHAELRRLAERNRRATDAAVFLGAGAYPHWIPAVVDQILLRSEFATAYTPYQAEVSQGTLQAIFEFQTFAALLLGLEVANASMYDGASAAAEAVLMARRLLPGRRTVWLARALHAHYRATIVTYLRGLPEMVVRELPFDAEGRTDMEALRAALGPDALCVVVGQPNVFGVVEDVAAVAAPTHEAGALVITATMEPLALAVVRPPGACGADIAVAEGQSFGLPVAYGGPGVGLFATHERFVRSMPGRLVGETVDVHGRRGFVLTLATREQHIRRERATSNICTNQGLCTDRK